MPHASIVVRCAQTQEQAAGSDREQVALALPVEKPHMIRGLYAAIGTAHNGGKQPFPFTDICVVEMILATPHPI